MRIARVVGQVVKVEKPTMTSTRRRYARVYVEIDLSKALLPRVNVDGVPRCVEYEGLHQICFDCGQYGHHANGCKGSSSTGENVGSAMQNDRDEQNESGPEQQGPYGPWMMPTYRNRKQRPNS